jgi:hypothetical protein
VKKDAQLRRFIVQGMGEDKGKRIDIEEHPEKIPGGWKLAEIDWDLTAIVEIEATDGKMLRGFAKFKNCCSNGNDRNPKFLWLKDPTGMCMKQAEKDLANTKLDGSLPEALPEVDEDLLPEAVPPRGLLMGSPGTVVEMPQGPTPAPEPVEVGPTQAQKEQLADSVLEKGVALGLDEHTTYAAWLGQKAKGITLEAFEKSLDAEIEKRKPKTATPAPRATRKPRTPPKPLITVVGQIDAIQEKQKADTKQEFLVLSVQQIDMYVWDKKLHNTCRDAYGTGTDVKVAYVISGDDQDPTQQFADVKEIELVEELETGKESASAVEQIADGVSE